MKILFKNAINKSALIWGQGRGLRLVFLVYAKCQRSRVGTLGRVIVDFLLKCWMATPNIDNIDKNQLNDEFRSIYFLKLAVQNRTSLMDISENSLIIIS